MNADKNCALFIGVQSRLSAAQKTFCLGWQRTSHARPAWRTRRQCVESLPREEQAIASQIMETLDDEQAWTRGYRAFGHLEGSEIVWLPFRAISRYR
jgi:hypothetical protein